MSKVAVLLAMLTGPCSLIATAESATLRLQTHHGLLTAEIESVPLQEILRALEESLGLKVHWLDASAAGMPISVSFKDVPVDISLKRILRNVSYTYFADGNTRKVLVLASQTSREFVAKAGGAPPVLAKPVAMLASAPTGTTTEDNVPAVVPEELLGASEEELTPLARAEGALASRDADTQLDGVQQLAQLAAADSGGMVAIQALKNAAQGSGRNNTQARLEAVKALSSAASDAASKQQALTALRVLSRNRDKSVRELAKRSMAELQDVQ